MKFSRSDFNIDMLPISPQQYRSLGTIMLGAGAFGLLLGVLFIVLTQAGRHGTGTKLETSAKECVEKIQKLGFNPLINNDTIRVSREGLANGLAQLAQSSQATSLCPNWQLQSYCLGEACQPAGVTFVLKYADKPITK